MSNLLPPENRKKLVREFYVRFLGVAALMALIGAIVATASLLPSIITVRIADAALQKSEAAISEATREDQKLQARTLSLMKALTPIATASTSPAVALESALIGKPPGLSITSIRYKKGEVVLSGVATKREAVSLYRDILQAEPRFTSVSVPVSSLAGSQDGRFTMTLTGEF